MLPLLVLPPLSFLLLSFLFSPVSSYQETPDYYQLCKGPYLFQCGIQKYNISYPFTVANDPTRQICGPPDYQLFCNDEGNMTIKIRDKYFQVLDIDYGQRFGDGIITVAAQDIAVDLDACNVQYGSSTDIDRGLFGLAPQDVSLTLYRCLIDMTPLPPSLQPLLPPQSCSYIIPSEWWYIAFSAVGEQTRTQLTSCNCTTTSVVIKKPFFDGLRNQIDPKLLGDALQQGFDIKWKAGASWCDRCLNSGGACGYNNSASSEQTCYRPDGHKESGSWKKGLNKAVKIGIGFAGLGLGIIVTGFVGVFVLRYRKRRLEKRNSSMTSSFFKSVTPSASSFGFGGGDEESPGSGYYKTPMFTYEELEEATGGFSHELGDGGFGTVYKGKLKDGRVVAIKCLHQNTFRRVQQFRNEIEILNRLRHQNLVTLYGCSTRESPKLLLIYEFVSNGTVADHLHGHLSTQRALTWSLRMSVAIESAAALAYLHAVKPQIIHRDVKTTNILLDSDFHVKVADFGLSRLFPDLGVTHVSTAPQGTPGYVDPEYHQCYQLTDKSDVYSFGVVLVELVSSMPAVDISRNRNEINLSNMAIQKIPAGLVGDLADAGLGYGSDSEVTRMVNAVCELAFRCLQQERDMRPSMQEVLDELVRIKGGGDSWGGGKKPGQHDKEKNSSRDDVYLLNTISQSGSSPPFSPNTINGTSWPSRSTATNASC